MCAGILKEKENSHMRWQLKEVNSHVGVHLLFAVDVQLFVRVHRHQQSPDVGL